MSHVAFRPALCSLEPELGDLGVETVSSLRETHLERWGAKPPTFQKGLRGPWGHPDPQKDRSPTIKQCKIPSQSTATLIKRSNGGQGVLYQCLIPGGTAAPQTPRTLQGGSGPWQGPNPLRSSSENPALGVQTASSLREIHQLRWGGLRPPPRLMGFQAKAEGKFLESENANGPLSYAVDRPPNKIMGKRMTHNEHSTNRGPCIDILLRA